MEGYEGGNRWDEYLIWKEKHEELDSEKVKCNRVVMIEEKQISVVSRYA